MIEIEIVGAAQLAGHLAAQLAGHQIPANMLQGCSADERWSCIPKQKQLNRAVEIVMTMMSLKCLSRQLSSVKVLCSHF